MKFFLPNILILQISSALHYLPYKKIRPLFLEMYHVVNDKNATLEHIIPQSIFKNADPKIKRDMHNLIIFPALGFSLLSIDDNFMFSSMCLGGRGVISVLANLFPQKIVSLYR